MGVSEPAADMRDIVLLPSKVIVPSRAAHVVERPAVTEKLARATSCPLTAVVSPAGFGKTTAVVSWLRTLKDVPCAWYLLDAEDAALDRFWLYLVTALRRADERICQSFDDVRLPDEFSKLRLALDALIIQMTEYGRDFVCVLEDFHEVHEDAGIHESVHYLLKHLPPNAHFVVTSRQALRFPIAKMRVEGALNEVGEADLRLSVDEAGALLAGMGMRMGTEQARAVHEATGGWATGIRLVALLCGDGSRTQVDEALACARVSINDYLFEEVFSVLSAKRRRFLAATSVVGSFCLPLTERITGLSREEAAEQVDYFVRNGLFVERFERKEGEDWYRYHPLLSDLLRQRLDRADDLDAAALGAAACAWLEEHGYFDSAVEVAADRGDYARVRQIIMDNWKRLYMSDSHYTVLRWASFLPDAEILASPLLCAVLAMPFALKGESERANAYLESAIARLHDDEDFLFALCLVQKAFMASFRNDWARMRQFATQALKYLPADEFYLRSMMLQVEASSSAAFDLLGAKAAFAQSLGMQLDYGNKCLSSSAFCNLSRICANLGHVQESRHYAERAFALYSEQERRFKPMLGYAYLSTMLCSYEEGDLERALREHETYLVVSSEGVVPGSAAEEALLLTKIRYRTGAPNAREEFFAAMAMDEDGAILASPSFAMALDWSRAFRTRALEEASSPFENRTTGVFRSMLAYCLDAVGRYEDACSFADATDEEDRSVYVRASVAACAFSEKVARLGRADAYFERAARHARASRLDSALAENLAFLRPAAQRFLAQTEDAALASYVRGLLDSDVDTGEASRLTEREADVMRCIAAGMTIAQAADKLFVSRETVKKHLANIYGKLGVHSKMQAVALLRDAGIV